MIRKTSIATAMSIIIQYATPIPAAMLLMRAQKMMGVIFAIALLVKLGYRLSKAILNV
jgi:hypothetical protein